MKFISFSLLLLGTITLCLANKVAEFWEKHQWVGAAHSKNKRDYAYGIGWDKFQTAGTVFEHGNPRERRSCGDIFRVYRAKFGHRNGCPIDISGEEIIKCGGSAVAYEFYERNRRRRGLRRSRVKRVSVPLSEADDEEEVGPPLYDYPHTLRLDFAGTIEVRLGADRTQHSYPDIELGSCTGSIIHGRFVLTAAHCIPKKTISVDNMMLTLRLPLLSILRRLSRARLWFWMKMKKRKVRKKWARRLGLPRNGGKIKYLVLKEMTTTVSYGGFKVNVETGVVTDLEDYDQIIIVDADNGKSHAAYHEGYITVEETEVLRKYASLLNDKEVKALFSEAPYLHLNDIAVIYLGEDQEFDLADYEKAYPICVPAGGADCPLREGEEVHMAGYGLQQEKERKLKARSHASLAGLKLRVEDIHQYHEQYYSTSYQARGIEGQNKQMDVVIGGPSLLTGVGSGDSGGAWVAPRLYKQNNDDDVRLFAMALVSSGLSMRDNPLGEEYGQDILTISEWIVDTMCLLASNVY